MMLISTIHKNPYTAARHVNLRHSLHKIKASKKMATGLAIGLTAPILATAILVKKKH